MEDRYPDIVIGCVGEVPILPVFLSPFCMDKLKGIKGILEL